ncbi:hypothetical protein B5X24_HaOG215782 [Helicoverpa armigera]|nr:hypothetical protein B5X24_HaOG215782 [Helicoverpa armigera]
MGKKRKLGAKDDEFEFDPIPRHLVTSHIKKQEKRLIVILENAQLETVKTGNSFELLNCDDHANILRKNDRDPGSCRPDITHQSLLMLMDSPLNRAVQLLHKFAIRASDGPMKLLKVIKNPVTSHLPVGVRKVTMSFSSKVVKNCRELVPKDEPIVMVIGAMAHGKVEVDYSEDVISISNYPLSAALTCAKLCTAFEEVWDVA